jgi:hypothetical protein
LGIKGRLRPHPIVSGLLLSVLLVLKLIQLCNLRCERTVQDVAPGASGCIRTCLEDDCLGLLNVFELLL